MYCDDLTLDKFMIFNKPVKTEKVFNQIKEKIQSQLGYYKHPKNLTTQDIAWLKKNVKQFDQKVLDSIIEKGRLPDKPKAV